MASDEYYEYTQSYQQHLYETKYLDYINIRGNNEIFKKIEFTYSSIDFLEIGAKKRYLTEIIFKDATGNALPSYNFDYYLSGTDVNPGAIKNLTDPLGGKVNYSYQTQELDGVTLSTSLQIPYVDYYDIIQNKPRDDGMAGKDFIVVRGIDYNLKVYRQGANGWYLDTTFPFLNNVWYTKVSSDYVILGVIGSDTSSYVVRRTEGGWESFNIDSSLLLAGKTLGATGVYPIGIGPNYFVVLHNGDFSLDIGSWETSLIMLTQKNLMVFNLTSERLYDQKLLDCYQLPYYSLIRAFCGQNYLVLASSAGTAGTKFQHYRYSSPGQWEVVGQYEYGNFFDLTAWRPHRVYIGENFVVVAHNDATCAGTLGYTEIKVYKRDGSTTGLNLIDSIFVGGGAANFIVTKDYYAYTRYLNGGGNPPNQIAIRVWDGNSFSNSIPALVSALNQNGSITSVGLTAVGNRLVINWWDSPEWSMSSLKYIPATQQWVNGQTNYNYNSIAGQATSLAIALDNTTLFEVCYRLDNSYPNSIFIYTYQFQGDSIVCKIVDSIKTNHYLPRDWIWQPGENFFAFARVGGEAFERVDPLNLYTLNSLSDGSMQFKEKPSRVVVSQKTISDGTGNDIVHNYSFQDGVINEYNTSEYGKVINTLPGSNGKIETSYYKSKDSTVSNVNYKYLSGLPYNIKEKNQSNMTIKEAQKNWTTVPIDPTNAVYFRKLLSDTFIIDGVTKTTEYDYNEEPYFQLTQITELNSDGAAKVTEYKYDNEKYPGMDEKNMLTQLYSTTVKKGINDVEYKKWTLWNNSDNYWRPREEWLWKGDGSSNDLTANEDPDGEAFKLKTYNFYDNSGNLLQHTDANANSTSTKWGHNNLRRIAEIKNAKNGECGYISLEDDWGDWESGGSTISISSAHTGLKSSISNNNYGPTKNFYVAEGIDKNKTYILEAWVSRTSGTATAAIQIRNSSNQDLSIKSITSLNQSGWQLISLKITPAEMESLPGDGHLRVWCGFNSGDNAGYVDDVRFYPADAQMITYTYNLVTLQPTSYSDENNNPTYFEYDGFGRLTYILNYKNEPLFLNSYPDMKTTNTNLYQAPNPDGFRQNFKDALGRPKEQKIQYESGFITTSQIYDAAGRLRFDYAPNGYAKEYKYFVDPLERVEQQGMHNLSPWRIDVPGDHPVKYEYGANDGSDGYTANTLYKTAVTDENGFKSNEYKDAFGNVIKKVSNVTISGIKTDTENLTTTFEYHILGNLTKSKPPKGNKDNTEDYNTIYEYNTFGQLTEKYSPDGDTVKYLYDKAGNLRFIQDANQSPSDKFTYQKYDAQNRLTEVGEFTASGSFIQSNADDISFPLEFNPNKVLQKKFNYDSENYTGQRNLKGKLSKSVAYKNGTEVISTFYSYSENGWIEWMLHKMPDLSDKKISYLYDRQGNVIKKCVTDLENNTLYTFYNYDMAGRLKEVYTNTIDSETGRVKEAEYTYNADGTIKRLQLANAQGMDYVYNERSWLTQINHQNLDGVNEGQPQDPGRDGFDSGFPGDKFGEVIGYNNLGHIADPSFGFNSQAQYNGNISWIITRTKDAALQNASTADPQPCIGYAYNYDGANRLTKSDFGYWKPETSQWINGAMYDLPTISYDANGNITKLIRNGVNGFFMDDFDYLYQNNTNRLTTLLFTGTEPYNYSYDNNGNVISDQYRGITGITYNTSNLPEQLIASETTVNYWYDASGNRIRKQAGDIDEIYVYGADGQTEAVFNVNGSLKFFNINTGRENIGRLEALAYELRLTNTTLSGNYTGNNITVDTNVIVTGSATLKAGNSITLRPGFRAAEGCNFTAIIDTNLIVTPERYYYLKDHLGSTRLGEGLNKKLIRISISNKILSE